VSSFTVRTLGTLNRNSIFGVALKGIALIVVCCPTDVSFSFVEEGCLTGETCFRHGVSSWNRDRLVGAGVTGDSNRFAARRGGIRAGVCRRTATSGDGDGMLSRIGLRASVISRRLRL
jgi:hypothetical protein